MTHTPSLVLALSLALASLTGCADDASPSAAEPFRAPTVATQGGTFSRPLDAAPSPDGATIYFVAAGGAHGAGLYRVAATGGVAAEVSVGAPFATPRGLAVSSDGQRVVVADATAGAGGGLYVVPVTGGTPTLLAGTEGTAPQGVEVASQAGADQVYFTGTSMQGEPAVFSVALAGGAARVLAHGAPLHRPQGVVANRAGVVFVADHTADTGVAGAVYRVESGVASSLLNNVGLGDPAGLALSPDEGTLGVSSIDPSTGTAQVVLVTLASGATSTYRTVIGANRSAGGVHRAHGGASTDLAWCGVTAGTAGTVYRIQFQ